MHSCATTVSIAGILSTGGPEEKTINIQGIKADGIKPGKLMTPGFYGITPAIGANERVKWSSLNFS